MQEELNEFTSSIEPGFGGTSADQLAELRTRRLLLNEDPSKDTRDMNQILREVLLRGQGVIHIERSPFPILFRHYGSNPQRFVEIAWILAMMQVKLSGTVVQVERMTFDLEGTKLRINFVGVRQKKYINAPAPRISVQGTCDLSP